MNREERIEEYYHHGTRELAEWLVDIEDQNDKLLSDLMSTKNQWELERNELDPIRLEPALRMYVAELDYDIHKSIECDEEDGLDHYPEEVEFFLRCWETAGEG